MEAGKTNLIVTEYPLMAEHLCTRLMSFKIIYLFIFRERGREEKERERNINVWLPFAHPLQGT